MDDRDDLSMFPTGDPVIDRGDALIRLAQAAEMTQDIVIRQLLLSFAIKVHDSVSVPSRQRVEGNLVTFPGGRPQ